MSKLFMESALTDTVLYKAFNGNAELTQTIILAIKKSITIDASYIQEQILQIQRTKISPLAEDVLEAFEKGDIVLLYSKIEKVPQTLPFFAMKTNGKIKAFVFLNNYGTISKSALNSEEKYYNISMKDLYVLMEGAYTAFKYAKNPMKVQRALGLFKLSTKIYTDMILRILNKEYAVSTSQDLYAKVSFSIGYFFGKTIWMSENSDVIFSYAYNTIPRGDRGVNTAEYEILKEQLDNVTNIKEFIDYLRDLDTKLKQINFRYFTQMYINTYKETSMFSLECITYFLFTIQASLIGSFIVKQPIISDITKNIQGMNQFYPELVRALS